MLGEIDFLNVAADKWTGDAHLDSLVEKTINNYIIKYKEVLSSLESATDKCKSVANVLEAVAVKHS